MTSEIAHFLLFGYDLEEFPGRGYLEAIGSGVAISEDEVVLLCHLCAVEEKDGTLVLVNEFPIVSPSESSRLTKAISPYITDDIHISFVPTRTGDGFLILSGAVSPAVTDSNPIHEDLPLIAVQPIEATPQAHKTAKALNSYLRWAYHTLESHPINRDRRASTLPPLNSLATQRAGKKRDLMCFLEKWGLNGLSISSGPIYWGLCRELGMDVKVVEDSGDPERDLLERLRVAHDAVEYDFVHVHTKVPDKAGHTKNPHHKKEMLEALDRAMDFAVQKIVPHADILLVVTADHSTASVGTMIHTGETVPVTMIGQYPRRDRVTAFNEIDCAQGALGTIRGKELMYLILNFLDRGKLKGLMDTPFDQPYTPGRYQPLIVNGD